jgi:hypothetical protein
MNVGLGQELQCILSAILPLSYIVVFVRSYFVLQFW